MALNAWPRRGPAIVLARRRRTLYRRRLDRGGRAGGRGARFPGRREPDRQPGARRAPGDAAAGDHPGPQTRGRVCQRRTGLGPRPDRARQPHGGRPLASATSSACWLRDAAGARRQWPGYTQEYPVARKLQEEARLVEQNTLPRSAAAWTRKDSGCAGACTTACRPRRCRSAGGNPAAFRAQDARAGLHRVRLRRRRTGTAGLAPHPHRPAALAGLPAGQWRARLDYERFWGRRDPPSSRHTRSTPDAARFHPASAPRFSQTGRHARTGR